MTLTLDATPGGAAANSYVLLADAEAYFAARPFSDAWTSIAAGTAGDQQKIQVLLYATKLLDRQRWLGARGLTPQGAISQALAWPRRWAPTPEFDAAPEFITEYFIDLSIAYYSSLTIPAPIVEATCELALELLRAGSTDPLTRDTTRNVKRKKTDVLETEYFDPALRVQGLGFFPSVVRLIAPLLRGGGIEVERA